MLASPSCPLTRAGHVPASHCPAWRRPAFPCHRDLVSSSKGRRWYWLLAYPPCPITRAGPVPASHCPAWRRPAFSCHRDLVSSSKGRRWYWLPASARGATSLQCTHCVEAQAMHIFSLQCTLCLGCNVQLAGNGHLGQHREIKT